jgi:ATP-dependent DNA helicase RecQ
VSTPDIHQVLKQYWGYERFRPLQEEIIQAVLAGKDTLALLPTGGGKSLCFQVPALVSGGICVVVSPLIALMKDQVENLRLRGIKAEAVYSGMSYREIDRILDNCAYGDIRFLYVSPERLATDLFKVRVQKMKVNLLAVDEAHCISQWGYDFRPEYLQIAEIRPLMKDIPVLALTASATSQVVEDIQQRLLFPKLNVFRKSFERKNLHYHVRIVEDKNTKMIDVCRNVKGTGIVYVRNRRSTKELAALLGKNKISADFYHAGLTHKEREQKQNNWKQNKTRVMVCTNAFGMGIDKPDVRFVVHYEIPDGPEAYYQEAGRAGRDEKKAFAVLLYNKADKMEAELKLKNSIPKEEDIKRVYHALGAYLNIAIGSGFMQTYPFDLAQFAQRFKVAGSLAYNSLKVLEQEGFIRLSDAIHEPSRVMFTVNNAELYRFQVAHAHFDPFIRMILRLYGGMFDEYVIIHEEDIAAKLKIPATDVVKFLDQLKQYNLIEYIKQTDSPKITFVKERFDLSNLRIDRKLLRFREEVQTIRLKAVIGYAEQYAVCRSRYLLHYFDEVNTGDCGVCDVCLLKNELDLNDTEIEEIFAAIQVELNHEPCDTKMLVKALRLQDKKVLAVLQLALEHDLVYADTRGMLNWRK